MNEIGGYFSLELKSGKHFHTNAINLNSARNCLEYILISKKYKHIYIPYYTCDSILEPITKHNISYTFYRINENLEPKELPLLDDNECFLYTNYFGIKDCYIKQLTKQYNKNLIIDNAQSFYSIPIRGTDTIYSPRKFFGVSDGGYLYCEKQLDIKLEQDISYKRFSHLIKRIDLGANAAFLDFRENDEKISNEPIKRMSNLTQTILASVDYENAKEKRINNFMFLHNKLKHINRLTIDDINNFECPLVYPFFTDDQNLKSKLIENKIYVATYWPNVFEWCKEEDFEYQLAKQLIALPIDQRYGINEMKKILEIIL